MTLEPYAVDGKAFLGEIFGEIADFTRCGQVSVRQDNAHGRIGWAQKKGRTDVARLDRWLFTSGVRLQSGLMIVFEFDQIFCQQ